MSREEVAAAVTRGFKSAEGLVTSSLRGLGNRRGATLVAAANRRADELELTLCDCRRSGRDNK